MTSREIANWRPCDAEWKRLINWGQTHCNPVTGLPWLVAPNPKAAELAAKVELARQKSSKVRKMERME